jgi:hypothetical protein
MSAKTRAPFLAAVLAASFPVISSALAEDFGLVPVQGGADTPPIVPTPDPPAAATSIVPTPEVTRTWNEVGTGLTGDALAAELARRGWSEMSIEPAARTTSFDVFSRPIAPGVETLLAVPAETTPQVPGPIEFFPAGSVQVAGLADYLPTKESIGKAMLSQIDGTLDSICAMERPPATVRVGLNVVGIGEVELIWNTVDDCEKPPVASSP